MIAVTGATGKLGRHVIEGLLKVVPAGEIFAAVRDVEKASDFAARGVQVRPADYTQPETLRAAFAGADKVLLISSNDVGNRFPQHQAVIDAAKEAGVKLIGYTGILNADSSTLKLAEEHKATEAAIRASGLPFVFLRNGWYLENNTEALAPALEHGTIMGASENGRFASAARKDYADAAVAVLTKGGHENKVYELAGDTSFTMTELAAEVSRQSGKTVTYTNLPEEKWAQTLQSFGLPASFAAILADSDVQASRGQLDSTSRDLSNLIGRPTTSLTEAVSQGLKS